MSDMIINDSTPVDKKWNELIKYNIFIMKLVEFGLALVLNIIPLLVESPGVLHCLAAGPTLVLSIIFVILYHVDQVPYEAEMYYAILQLAFNVMCLIHIMTVVKFIYSIYIVFYIDLILVFAFDIHFMKKERGWTL